MKTFFVEQSNKVGRFKGIVKKITIKDNKIIINVSLEKYSIEKKAKMAKKIKQILINNNIKQIALHKSLKQDQEFVNLLYGYNINICSEKWIFKKLTNEIILELLGERKKEEMDIYICINDLDNFAEKLIYIFALEFKTLNIVTKHIGKFKTIENNLYKNDGILINITNNKRKSLKNAEFILNIDFPTEILNQFTLYDNSTIITWEDDIKILKKRFNGKIIRKINYSFEDEKIEEFVKLNYLDGYDKSDLCQVLEIVPKGKIVLN